MSPKKSTNGLRFSRRALGLGGVLAASTLAGCSNDSSGGGALGSGESLTVITSQAPWNPAYESVVEEFQKATGVQVDLRPFPNDDVKTQVLNDIRSGNQTFDVIQINEPDVAQFNDEGWFTPFTDIDESYKLDAGTFNYANISYWDHDTGTFAEGGELTVAPLMGNMQLLVYRLDIYEELGLEVPTSWDEVIANAKRAQESGLARYGFVNRLQAIPGASSITYDFLPFFFSQGAQWFADEGTDWTPTIDSDAGVRAATLFYEAAKYGPADTRALGQAEAIAVMQAGDSAQLQVVAAAADSFQNEANSNVVGKVGYAPLPVDPGGNPAVATGLWNLGIPAGLDDARARLALQFIDWVSSPDGMKVFAENGGVPTNEKVYTDPGLSDVQAEYLGALLTSAPNAQAQLRYIFAPAMLELTEKALANIAAGEVTPEEGMGQLQDQVVALTEDLDLPKG